MFPCNIDNFLRWGFMWRDWLVDLHIEQNAKPTARKDSQARDQGSSVFIVPFFQFERKEQQQTKSRMLPVSERQTSMSAVGSIKLALDIFTVMWTKSSKAR